MKAKAFRRMNFQNCLRSSEKLVCVQLKEKAVQALGLRLLKRSLNSTAGRFPCIVKLVKDQLLASGYR